MLLKLKKASAIKADKPIIIRSVLISVVVLSKV
jgi:hypothetical protein